MTTTADLNTNYNDFAGLARMRADARMDSEAALKEVAKQFESVFVQMMIKSMRDASVPLQGELFHSNQSQAYTEMYDKQLGVELSKENGIGLADVIVRQLSPRNYMPAETDVAAPALQFNHALAAVNANRLRTATDADENSELIKTTTASLDFDPDVTVQSVQQTPHWSAPEDFIRDSWPHAVRAGNALGVDPRVIIAQSALETGWGKKVHHTAEGENSYCLFGIKADQRWQGKSVAFDTLEFRSGVMGRERATFRSYDSMAESYQDYVDFLQSNPRYQQALSASSEQYAQSLQQAGYATDPDYASKIERIQNSDLMNNTLSALKVSDEVPLT